MPAGIPGKGDIFHPLLKPSWPIATITSYSNEFHQLLLLQEIPPFGQPKSFANQFQCMTPGGKGKQEKMVTLASPAGK